MGNSMLLKTYSITFTQSFICFHLLYVAFAGERGDPGLPGTGKLNLLKLSDFSKKKKCFLLNKKLFSIHFLDGIPGKSNEHDSMFRAKTHNLFGFRSSGASW